MPVEDVAPAKGVARLTRLGREVEVPDEGFAFVTEHTVASVLRPDALNGGNLVDIYQKREEDFLAKASMEVWYYDAEGAQVRETMYVLEPAPPSVPRVCIAAEAVRGMHKAISVLTRKVDNLNMTLRSCREHYYKELTFLRHGSAEVGYPDVYYFNPKMYEDHVTKELVQKLIHEKVTAYTAMLEQKEAEIQRLTLLTQAAMSSEEAKSDLQRLRKLMAGLPLDQLLHILKTANAPREGAFYEGLERLLADRNRATLTPEGSQQVSPSPSDLFIQNTDSSQGPSGEGEAGADSADLFAQRLLDADKEADELREELRAEKARRQMLEMQLQRARPASEAQPVEPESGAPAGRRSSAKVQTSGHGGQRWDAQGTESSRQASIEGVGDARPYDDADASAAAASAGRARAGVGHAAEDASDLRPLSPPAGQTTAADSAGVGAGAGGPRRRTPTTGGSRQASPASPGAAPRAGAAQAGAAQLGRRGPRRSGVSPERAPSQREEEQGAGPARAGDPNDRSATAAAGGGGGGGQRRLSEELLQSAAAAGAGGGQGQLAEDAQLSGFARRPASKTRDGVHRGSATLKALRPSPGGADTERGGSREPSPSSASPLVTTSLSGPSRASSRGSSRATLHSRRLSQSPPPLLGPGSPAGHSDEDVPSGEPATDEGARGTPRSPRPGSRDGFLDPASSGGSAPAAIGIRPAAAAGRAGDAATEASEDSEVREGHVAQQGAKESSTMTAGFASLDTEAPTLQRSDLDGDSASTRDEFEAAAVSWHAPGLVRADGATLDHGVSDTSQEAEMCLDPDMLLPGGLEVPFSPGSGQQACRCKAPFVHGASFCWRCGSQRHGLAPEQRSADGHHRERGERRKPSGHRQQPGAEGERLKAFLAGLPRRTCESLAPTESPDAESDSSLVAAFSPRVHLKAVAESLHALQPQEMGDSPCAVRVNDVFSPGTALSNVHLATLTSREALDSKELLDLPPGSRVTVVMPGSRPGGRRLYVRTEDGLEGWVTSMTASGRWIWQEAKPPSVQSEPQEEPPARAEVDAAAAARGQQLAHAQEALAAAAGARRDSATSPGADEQEGAPLALGAAEGQRGAPGLGLTASSFPVGFKASLPTTAGSASAQTSLLGTTRPGTGAESPQVPVSRPGTRGSAGWRRGEWKLVEGVAGAAVGRVEKRDQAAQTAIGFDWDLPGWSLEEAPVGPPGSEEAEEAEGRRRELLRWCLRFIEGADPGLLAKLLPLLLDAVGAAGKPVAGQALDTARRRAARALVGAELPTASSMAFSADLPEPGAVPVAKKTPVLRSKISGLSWSTADSPGDAPAPRAGLSEHKPRHLRPSQGAVARPAGLPPDDAPTSAAQTVRDPALRPASCQDKVQERLLLAQTPRPSTHGGSRGGSRPFPQAPQSDGRGGGTPPETAELLPIAQEFRAVAKHARRLLGRHADQAPVDADVGVDAGLAGAATSPAPPASARGAARHALLGGAARERELMTARAADRWGRGAEACGAADGCQQAAETSADGTLEERLDALASWSRSSAGTGLVARRPDLPSGAGSTNHAMALSPGRLPSARHRHASVAADSLPGMRFCGLAQGNWNPTTATGGVSSRSAATYLQGVEGQLRGDSDEEIRSRSPAARSCSASPSRAVAASPQQAGGRGPFRGSDLRPPPADRPLDRLPLLRPGR